MDIKSYLKKNRRIKDVGHSPPRETDATNSQEQEHFIKLYKKNYCCLRSWNRRLKCVCACVCVCVCMRVCVCECVCARARLRVCVSVFIVQLRIPERRYYTWWEREVWDYQAKRYLYKSLEETWIWNLVGYCVGHRKWACWNNYLKVSASRHRSFANLKWYCHDIN